MIKNKNNFFLDDKLFKDILDDFVISPDLTYQLCASLSAGKNIILDGTPGTGKTELAIKLCELASQSNLSDGYILTTATSDWSTFDIIGGWMPNKNNLLTFHKGKFLEAIASNKWLIIDEINRADIDKAFGQLFTILSGHDIELPYHHNGKTIKIVIWDENYCKYDETTATYFIGTNWRIIGTMNIDDKDSLFDLSYAFMRRFMLIEIDLPSKTDYVNLIRKWASDLDESYLNKLLELYSIEKYKKIGPAIFKDIIDFIEVKEELMPNNYDLTFSEAISSYILPQLEGINQKYRNEIKEFFEKLGVFKFIEEEYNKIFTK